MDTWVGSVIAIVDSAAVYVWMSPGSSAHLQTALCAFPESLHWYLKIHSLLGEWSAVILPCSVGFFPTLMRIYFAVQLTWLNLFFLAYVLENMSEEKLRFFFFSFKISSSSSIVGNLGLGGRFWVDCCIWWEKRAWGWRLCLWIVSFPSDIVEMDFPFEGACSWHFCIKPGSCRHVFSCLCSATLTYVYICMLGYWELGLSQGGLVTRKIWLAWKVDLPPGPEEVGVHLITSGQWLRQLSLIIRAS